MKKIENIKQTNSIIYAGNFDLNDNGKIININLEKEDISIDLNICVSSNHKILENIETKSILELCRIINVICSIYPNGNVSFRKFKSNNELNSCYFSIINSNSKNYLICIAFDETQPALYKAELVAVLEL